MKYTLIQHSAEALRATEKVVFDRTSDNIYDIYIYIIYIYIICMVVGNWGCSEEQIISRRIFLKF